MSRGATRSIAEPSSAIAATTTVPGTMEAPTIAVVSLMIAAGRGMLVGRPMSCSKEVRRKRAVLRFHGPDQIVFAVGLKMLHPVTVISRASRISTGGVTYLEGICEIVRVCESDNAKGGLVALGVGKVTDGYILKSTMWL